MQRLLGYAILTLLFGGLLALLTYATYWQLAPQRGLGWAIAVWPGLPIMALVLMVVVGWAIDVTAPKRDRHG